MRSAWRDAEFLLAEREAFLLLLLRDFWRLGGWEGAPEGGIKMAGVGAGEASVAGQRDAGPIHTTFVKWSGDTDKREKKKSYRPKNLSQT